jgi:hypothetical protein
VAVFGVGLEVVVCDKSRLKVKIPQAQELVALLSVLCVLVPV